MRLKAVPCYQLKKEKFERIKLFLNNFIPEQSSIIFIGIQKYLAPKKIQY